jgi:hypothetical protein
MADPYGNLSPEEYQQQQAINRQQQLASMLMQNNQQPQGQMVSGRYVPTSFFQNILPLVNTYVGKGLLEQGDIKAAKLAEAIRNRNATEAQDIVGTLRGTPAQAGNLPLQGSTQAIGSIEEPVGEYKAPVAAVAGNKDLALMKALKSTSPIAANIANTLITKSLESPKEFNLGIGETRYRQGPNGEVIQLAQGKNKEIEQPAEIKLALSLDRSLPRDPATWTQADADKANAQILKHIREKRPVNINSTTVLGGEKQYDKTFGEELAKQDMTLIQAARSAPQILANNKRQLDLLNGGNVITGVGANQRLDLARFGQAIGVGGKGDIVANTQQLLAGRAGSVLDSIKASGLGAGNGFSNADRDFLEKAKLGGITYDATALKRQLQIENNVTKAMVNQYNQRIKDMPVAGNLKLQPVNVDSVEYLGPVK